MHPNSSTESIAISADGRIVGEVRGTTFTKRIRGSLHLLRQPPAIALSVSVLAQAERAGRERLKSETSRKA